MLKFSGYRWLAIIAGFSGTVWAQPALTLSSGTGAASGTVALNLSVSSPAGSEPAALEWTLTYPSASISSVSVAAGPAATAAGKSISCSGGAAGYTCVAYGMNSNIISNGVVAIVTATLTANATTAAISIASGVGASGAGSPETVTASGGGITIPPLSNSSPTLTSVSCTPTALASGASSSCTVQLSAAAGAGGAAVGLTSTATSLTVPASVTVAAGSSTGTFKAAAGSFSSNQTVTITATLNKSTATTSISLAIPVQVSSVQCVVSSLSQNASTTCSVKLSQAAPSGGAVVSVTSSVAALTVPASFTIAAGATSGSFTISTGTISSAQTATITVAYNQSSTQTSISLTAATAVSSLLCALSTLPPNTATNCTATLSASAQSTGVTITLGSSTTLLTVPASISVPANTSAVSFPVSTGAFTTGQTAKITASTGSQSVSTTVALFTLVVNTRFSLAGSAAELSSRSNGSAVNPTLAPSSLGGKVVVNGTGSVNLVSGSGVYFLNCCANTNNAYFKFAGAAAGSIFNIPQGQISFALQSRYSFAQRKSSASAQRYAFDVRDANGHQYYFMTQVVSGSLVFYYLVGGTQLYYYVPSGTEDQLFGSGVSLKVAIGWTGSTATLSLNGAVVKSSPYTPATANWSSASNFDIGAYEYENVGGYSSSDDIVGNFVVSVPNSSNPSTVSSLSTAVSRRVFTSTPVLGSGSRFSCAPVAAGSSALCELKVNPGSVTADSEVSVSSSSDHVMTPSAITLARGTGKMPFEVLTQPDTPEGTVSIEVQSGAETLRTSLPVSRSAAPVLAAPSRQNGIPGQPVQFDVIAADEQPLALSASSLPSGATFDTNTGTFTWVPTAQDLGRHTIEFTATNSLGLSSTKSVEVTITREQSNGAPEILTVGDKEQALAVHSDSSVLAAIPNVRFNGVPAHAGDLVSVSAAGIDCNQNPALRNFQLKLGSQYVPVQSIQPTEGAPAVCSITFEVPAGTAEGRTPLSIDVAGPGGRVLSSNVASIAVTE